MDDRDPDRSFIVLRWLARLDRCDFNFLTERLISDYTDVVADTSPEWEYVDQFFNSFLGVFKRKSMHAFDTMAKILETIIRSISYAISHSR